MKNNEVIEQFFNAAYQWICDGYYVSLRYIILKDNSGRNWLTSLLAIVSPLLNERESEFEIDGRLVKAGQILVRDSAWDDISAILAHGAGGRLELGGEVFSMRLPDLLIESDMLQLDRFECNLHLRAFAKEDFGDKLFDFPSIDAELRQGELPFDGLQDLAAWLDVNNPSTISVSEARLIVHPPIEFIWEDSRLSNNVFTLSLIAHHSIDLERVSIAVRAQPNHIKEGRKQLGDFVKWENKSGFKKGDVSYEFNSAENIMLMISYGGATVRRQFFVDPTKAKNLRYLAINQFDNDLQKLKQNLFNDKQRKFFEEAINVLLFMLGYISTRLPGTDGPDLITTTFDGQFIVIECTKSISDFSTKLGKLVGRRAALERTLKEAGQSQPVKALLVTAQPAAEVASKQEELVQFNVRLMTSEDLQRLVMSLPGETSIARKFDGVDYEGQEK